MYEKISKVIDEKVRPYLSGHNGDIEVLDFENGILKIKLLGKCSGCLSAKYTVEEIVETSLKAEIPEIKKVELVDYLSDETLDMARKILSKNK
ncbi:NifU family protein [Clostridium fermenticellae]|uniref:NifU family protein n=1 Tax=Clostridium fermenticellae TaxID=2068654 RepID=A0A386H5T4_9CLOT|nr:NifU family protein [Clostridium fermenticellae]AYD41107.1 NifU family protein [Clostridium fermenticellae]